MLLMNFSAFALQTILKYLPRVKLHFMFQILTWILDLPEIIIYVTAIYNVINGH